jgi:hypothetical protein
MDLRSALIDTILTEYKKIFNLTEAQENDILIKIPSLSDTELIREIGYIEEYYQESKNIYQSYLRDALKLRESLEETPLPSLTIHF